MQLPDLDHFLLLLFIISSLLNTTCGVDHSKYTLLVEREISVQRGLCVYIPCTFTVEFGPPSAAAFGTWYKGDSNGEVVSSQNPSEKPPKNPGRIFFTGDARKLDCSMSINDVQSSDGGTYLFRLQDVGGVNYNYGDYKIKLTVTDLTEKPVITPVMALLAGKEVTMSCESPGRCNGSAPLITWETRVVLRTNVSYQTIYSDGNKTYYSNITFTPSNQDHQSPLTCIVNFQSSSVSTRKEIILNVEYPPNVSITVNDNIQNENTPIIVKEGDSETIRCMVDSNPNSTIIWTRGDKTLPGTLNGQTSIYNVQNANPNDTGIYRCSANNSHSSITRSVTITVHYAPRTPQIDCLTPKDCPIDGNNTIFIKEGSSLTLRCSAESLPVATLAWSAPRNSNIINLNGEIRLPNMQRSDDGSYTCRAKNIYDESSASVTIKVTSLLETSSLGMIAAVSVVLAVSVILGIAFIILQYSRRRKLKQESKDEKDLTSNSQDAIYSNASVFCNNGEISQEIPNKNMAEDDRTVYMNCEDVQYASINFARMKPKPSKEVTEPETEYAVIKPR